MFGYAARSAQRTIAMRYFVSLLIGLLIGAITATMAASSLQQRHAYPRGLMRVLQHHASALRAAERTGACTDAMLATHFGRIADLANDIPASVYLDPSSEPHFIEFSAALRQAAARGRTTPHVNCEVFSAALRNTTEACESCHREYR